MVTMFFWCVSSQNNVSFAPRYLAFKIEFEGRDARVPHLQHAVSGYMYMVSSAMKMKDKIRGGKAIERGSFLNSLASSRCSGQMDRQNVTNSYSGGPPKMGPTRCPS